MNKNILWVDFETVSSVDINRGSHLYAMKARPVLLGYAVNDEPADCINFFYDEVIPDNVDAILRDDDWLLGAFNCDFERQIFKHCFPQYDIKYERWFDVMFQAREHGLAGSLQTISEVFDSSKVIEGAAELRKLIKWYDKVLQCREARRSILRGKFRHSYKELKQWLTVEPPNMELLAKYCMGDVIETRERSKQLPLGNYDSNFKEMRLAKLTAEINDRGLPIDLTFVQRAQMASTCAKDKLNDRITELTDGEVKSGYQYAAFSKYLTSKFGISPNTSTGSESIKKVQREATSEELKQLCEVWLSKGTAVSKFDALLNATDEETERCYGTLAFCGAARTKRWSGRLYQPQNLKRPDLEADEIDEMVDRILSELPQDVAEWYTVDELGDGVRACICAPERKLLIAADLSAIEQRSLMWMINDEENLRLFNAIDNKTSTYDPYQLTYANAFGVADPSTVDKDKRFVGKVMSLLLQYMGGVTGLYNGIVDGGADIDKFVKLVLENTTEEEQMKAESEYNNMKKRLVKNIKKREYIALAAARTRWRDANPRVVNFGRALERGFISALTNPGYAFVALNQEQDAAKQVTFLYNKNLDFLKMGLPVGALYYPMPRLQEIKVKMKNVDGEEIEIEQFGITVRQADKKAPRVSYYAGKLLENVASGLSREIVAEGMLRADAQGIELLTMIHDEIVAEAYEADAEFELKVLIEAMTDPIDKLPGFPLAAKGFVSKRYKKD